MQRAAEKSGPSEELAAACLAALASCALQDPVSMTQKHDSMQHQELFNPWNLIS